MICIRKSSDFGETMTVRRFIPKQAEQGASGLKLLQQVYSEVAPHFVQEVPASIASSAAEEVESVGAELESERLKAIDEAFTEIEFCVASGFMGTVASEVAPHFVQEVPASIASSAAGELDSNWH